jgi:hypothetical protein
MFADYLVNLVGQFARTQIELVLVGNEYKCQPSCDPLNLPDSRMKNIVGERPFLPTFFGCRKKVWSFGRDANRKTAWMLVSAAHKKT